MEGGSARSPARNIRFNDEMLYFFTNCPSWSNCLMARRAVGEVNMEATLWSETTRQKARHATKKKILVPQQQRKKEMGEIKPPASGVVGFPS
jgi:hypothetical protein